MTTQRVKAPFYAYPSSIHAHRMGRARAGCYGVNILDRHADHDVVLTHGPFDTLEAAESFAAGLPLSWWAEYLRRPLPGSTLIARSAAS